MNNQKLKNEVKILQQPSKIRTLLKGFKEHWKLWLPIVISAFAFGASIWANIMANKANVIAARSLSMEKKLSKLDFRPIIILDTLFKPAGKVPPHLSITNIGSIRAEQVEIKMHSDRYFPKKKKIGASVWGSFNDIIVGNLEPQETKAYKFRKNWVNFNAKLHNPPQHNIMEIQIVYKRPQDLKEYNESAYYFVNPDGLWVGERSGTLESELYESIKSSISNIDKEKYVIYKERKVDKLHSNK